MQTPVQIDFQGTKPSPALRDNIERHVSGLEERFGRITSCRVVLKAPGGHHRIGPFEVNIHLALPDGRHVEVTRTPQADERQADVEFAINDAFKRARRKLQDRVRRMQGQVKTPERLERRLLASEGRRTGHIRRGTRRERAAGQHCQAARKA
jgi:ribosome-associated translation inhibitor RaiA